VNVPTSPRFPQFKRSPSQVRFKSGNPRKFRAYWKQIARGILDRASGTNEAVSARDLKRLFAVRALEIVCESRKETNTLADACHIPARVALRAQRQRAAETASQSRRKNLLPVRRNHDNFGVMFTMRRIIVNGFAWYRCRCRLCSV